jgi:hypothetical protein
MTKLVVGVALAVAGCASNAADGSPSCGNGVHESGELCFEERVESVPGAMHVDVGDVDADGLADLVVTNASTDSLQVRRGDGRFFGPARDIDLRAIHRIPGYAGVLGLGAALLCDFDGDGDSDVAVHARLAGAILVLVAEDGELSVSADYISTNGGTHRLACGDLNNDALSDLIVASDYEPARLIRVYFGDREAVLGAPLGFTPDTDMRALAVADLDEDGDLDVVGAADRGVDELGAVENLGEGRFVQRSSAPVGGGVHGIATGHFDDDGFVDVVTANTSTDDLTILHGAGDTTFSVVEILDFSGERFGSHIGPEDVKTADVDGDGDHDLVVAHLTANTFTTLVQRSPGVFDVGATRGVPGFPTSLATADFNGDGLPDFALACAEQHYDAYDRQRAIELGLGQLVVLLSNP